MIRSCSIAVILASLVLLLAQAQANNEQHEGEARASQSNVVLRSANFSAGGFVVSTPEFTTGGTLGQPTPIGIGSDGEHELLAGFWPPYIGEALSGIRDIHGPLHALLCQNYPNPFNPATSIVYAIAGGGIISLKIFNVRGELVRTLVHANKTPGTYREMWDGRDDKGLQVASGVYFCLLEAGNYLSVKRMLMLK